MWAKIQGRCKFRAHARLRLRLSARERKKRNLSFRVLWILYVYFNIYHARDLPNVTWNAFCIHTHTYAIPRSVLYIRWWTLARERFTSFPCIVRKGKSSWETQAASNSDGNESSATDDEDDEETRKSSKRGGALRRSEESTKKKQRNRRKLPTIVYTDAQLSGLLKDVIDKGEYRCPLVFFSSLPRRASAFLWLMKAHLSLEWPATLVSFTQDKCFSGKKGRRRWFAETITWGKKWWLVKKVTSRVTLWDTCLWSDANHAPQILRKRFFSSKLYQFNPFSPIYTYTTAIRYIYKIQHKYIFTNEHL